jgi:hypothetical protein
MGSSPTMSLLRTVAGLMAASALALGCANEQASCNCTEAPRGCVYTGRADCPCAAMVCSDIGPVIDLGNAVMEAGTDAGTDAGIDAGMDVPTDRGGLDAGMDVPTDRGGLDAGMDAPTDRGGLDAGMDVPTDRGVPDVGMDVPTDRGVPDVGMDVAVDRGIPDEARVDVQGVDAPRNDAGLLVCPAAPSNRSCAMDSECTLGFYPVSCVGEQRAIGYNPRALAEFTALRACWTLAVAEMVRCSARLSRGTEIEQTGMFVIDPMVLEASCRDGQCAAGLR